MCIQVNCDLVKKAASHSAGLDGAWVSVSSKFPGAAGAVVPGTKKQEKQGKPEAQVPTTGISLTDNVTLAK